MKHTLRVLTLSLFLALSSTAIGQLEILAGAGFSFGTEASALGLHLRGDVDITDKWGGSVNIIPYFKKDYNYWEINFDARYVLYDSDPWMLYPLAGINLTTFGYKGSASSIGGFKVKATRIGLNIGGGARYTINDQFAVVAEIKYILSQFDQLVISAAGLYHF